VAGQYKDPEILLVVAYQTCICVLIGSLLNAIHYHTSEYCIAGLPDVGECPLDPLGRFNGVAVPNVSTFDVGKPYSPNFFRSAVCKDDLVFRVDDDDAFRQLLESGGKQSFMWT
jgi:hypothetical protein